LGKTARLLLDKVYKELATVGPPSFTSSAMDLYAAWYWDKTSRWNLVNQTQGSVLIIVDTVAVVQLGIISFTLFLVQTFDPDLDHNTLLAFEVGMQLQKVLL
jgi:hypothetical protein